MEFLRYFWDAAVELDEKATIAAYGEGQSLPHLSAGTTTEHSGKLPGLVNITVEPLDVPTRPIEAFESYWQPYHTGQLPCDRTM